MSRYYYDICLNRPTTQLFGAFTYSSDLPLEIGTLVQVVFRGQKVCGVIYALVASPNISPARILSIQKVLSRGAVIDRRGLELARIIARYYITSLGEVIFAMLPPVPIARKLFLAAIRSSRTDPSTSIILERDFSSRMLHYTSIIKDVIERGGQVIVLMPNRRMSNYAAKYFETIFSINSVVNIKSLASRSTVVKQYSEIIEGKKNIIIGTRKAVFAPAPNLRLIIMEEPSNYGYFNDQKPAYSARVVVEAWRRIRGVTTIYGMSVVDNESLWQLKHKEQTSLGGRPKNSAEIAWLEGDYKAELAKPVGKTKLIVVPFAKGMVLICPYCARASLCANCQASLAADGNGMAVCSRGHRAPLSPCSGCGAVFPVYEGLTPESVANQVSAAPTETIYGQKSLSPGATKRRPLVVVATAKILDYPELTFDETVILAADVWLSFSNPQAISNFLKLFWQLKSQTTSRLVVHSFQAQPSLQKYTHAPKSVMLGAFMKQYHQLNLPPFTRKIIVLPKKGTPSISKILSVQPTAENLYYLPRSSWPLAPARAEALYGVCRKVTIDAPY